MQTKEEVLYELVMQISDLIKNSEIPMLVHEKLEDARVLSKELAVKSKTTTKQPD